MNPGFWHSNFYPDNFWHEDFWQDFGGLTTNALHIFSTGNLDSNHVTDSGNNVLIAGDIEIQGDVYTNDIYIPDFKALIMGTLQQEAVIFWWDANNAMTMSSDGGIDVFAQTTVLIDAPNTKIGSALNYLNVDELGIQTFVGSSAIHGLRVNTTRITSSPYTALVTDDDIFVDTDGGAITINLPAGIDGKKYTIKNVGTSGNSVTLSPNGAELLFGENSDYVILDRGDDEQITYETTEGWG
jgi:hypothetical protein